MGGRLCFAIAFRSAARADERGLPGPRVAEVAVDLDDEGVVFGRQALAVPGDGAEQPLGPVAGLDAVAGREERAHAPDAEHLPGLAAGLGRPVGVGDDRVARAELDGLLARVEVAVGAGAEDEGRRVEVAEGAVDGAEEGGGVPAAGVSERVAVGAALRQMAVT
jgi:hypothetical protein